MKVFAKGVAVLTVGMLLAAPSLKAQGVEFGLGGGIGVPLGTFDDEAKLGWHGLAELSFVPNGWPVGIQFDGSYQQFSVDDAAAPAGFSGLKRRFLMGTGNIVFKFKSSEESTFRPYLIGGAGVYNTKLTGQDDPSDILGGGTTDFGLNAGVGFDFKAGGAGLFVEGRFHDVFTDGENLKFIPITLGIRLGGS
jgi:outer membrane protein with beta-barrel domain